MSVSIKIPFYFLSVLFLNSCLSDEIDSGDDIIESPKMIECLQFRVPKYFDYSKEFNEIFHRDLLIDDTPQSYSIAYEKLSNNSLFSEINLSTNEIESLDKFKYDMDLPIMLFSCTQLFERDKSLSPVQKEFYKSYNQSIKLGGIDTGDLSRILSRMDNNSFKTNGVKEVTVFYLIFEIFNSDEVVETDSE